ncbi:MAG: energy transducer TonB [Flavobacterium sp.]|uniref:energy transducer TonB n=1 Tax=Flavobacterium sp. TaxID=239 RepID=UPI00260F4149|nr:energy transducer TonB [Flavobacterium sp.]MDD5149650.1 energy transducer TonB [Flavobacterium sp.]
MKKTIFLVIAFFSIQIVLAQTTTNDANNNVYNTAGIEVKPEFPGGIGEFYKFIASNYNTPASKEFLGGKVYVTFIIEKDGQVSDIQVLRDVGFDSGKEAIRVLELCPKWIPGQQNGQNVRCTFSLPISLQAYVFDIKEVDVAPNYLGGFEGVSKLILENFNAPTSKEFKGGKVLISFTVEVDGNLSDIQIYKDLGFGTGEEAVRVLKTIKNWIPAQKNGKKVRCSFGIPITLNSN